MTSQKVQSELIRDIQGEVSISLSKEIVSVHHQNEGGIGKSIPDARGKSQGSREIWRAEGMDFPIPPEFWWSTDNLSASIFLQGVDHKILPCGQGRIDSVKINPSLLMMTDCKIHYAIQVENLSIISS